MSHLGYDENEVIRRCQAGDVQAFEQLYLQHAPALLAVAGRLLNDRQDAQDAVQTAFVKLYSALPRFRGEARFSTYMYRILLNACFDLLHKKRRTENLEVCTAVSVQPDWDLAMQLEQAIAQLPERMRACFVLFAVEQWPYQDIAEALNLSLGGVKATIFQARRRLRQWLNENDGASL